MIHKAHEEKIFEESWRTVICPCLICPRRLVHQRPFVTPALFTFKPWPNFCTACTCVHSETPPCPLCITVYSCWASVNLSLLSPSLSLENFRPAVAGQASKMARTRSRRVEMRGNPNHQIWNFALFDFVCGQISLKMHEAMGNHDVLPFQAAFGFKIMYLFYWWA